MSNALRLPKSFTEAAKQQGATVVKKTPGPKGTIKVELEVRGGSTRHLVVDPSKQVQRYNIA